MNWIQAYKYKIKTTGSFWKQREYVIEFEETPLFNVYDLDTAISLTLKLNGAYNMGYQKGLINNKYLNNPPSNDKT